MMKKHHVSPLLAAAAAALLSVSLSPAAHAAACGELTCHVEIKCIIVDVECGQNDDGTPIFCQEQLCGEVDVCVQESPCDTFPVPDPPIPDLDEFPPFPTNPGDPAPF